MSHIKPNGKRSKSQFTQIKPFPQIIFQRQEIPLVTMNSLAYTWIYSYIHCCSTVYSNSCILLAPKPPCHSISNSTKQWYCLISKVFPGGVQQWHSDINPNLRTSMRKGDRAFKLIYYYPYEHYASSTLEKHFCKYSEYAIRLRKSETFFELPVLCQLLLN